jgi:hypothetical protein
LEKFTLLEAVGPHFSFGTRIAPGGREGTRGPWGLICPLEQGLRLEAWRDARPVLSFGTRIASGGNEGHGACFVLWSNLEAIRGDRAYFVLWKQVFHLEALRDCRAVGPHLSFGSKDFAWRMWGTRGPGGLICLSEQRLRLEAMRGRGASLSFGNRVACGGREGLEASFVLRKQDCVWRP